MHYIPDSMKRLLVGDFSPDSLDAEHCGTAVAEPPEKQDPRFRVPDFLLDTHPDVSELPVGPGLADEKHGDNDDMKEAQTCTEDPAVEELAGTDAGEMDDAVGQGSATQYVEPTGQNVPSAESVPEVVVPEQAKTPMPSAAALITADAVSGKATFFL